MRPWLAAGIVALTSCGLTEPEPPPFRLTLTLSSEELTIGDSIDVRVVARNPSDTTRSARIRRAGSDLPYCVFQVQVFRETDSSTEHIPRLCNDIGAGPYAVAPGDSLVEVLRFDGKVIGAARAGYASLDSGTYHLVADFRDDPGSASNYARLLVRH